MEIKKTVAFTTLGCKVNSYETEAVQQLFIEEGYEIVDFEEIADIYIVNTCTVTNIADRKSRQMLHKAKKLSPSSTVVAIGCYVQGAKDILEKDKAIDIIVGNNKKKDIINIINNHQQNQQDIVKTDLMDIGNEVAYEELIINNMSEKTRAYIKIQDGCNQFCSYCIIPYVRGRVRSRSQENIYEEVERMAYTGYKEIVLTGIHITSYGTDLSKENKQGDELIKVISKLCSIEGIKRIRLGSIEPSLITDEFAKVLSENKKICPHFHLSLQSGCDSVLKRMNRRYTTGEYYKKCEILNKYFQNPAITTDVIVGFPGETEEEFMETYEFLQKVSFSAMHIFQYSKREGTKAATMENQVDKKLMKERSIQLAKLGRRHKSKYLESFTNKETKILVEETVEINNKMYQLGHNERYVKIGFESDIDCTNTIVKGEIIGQINDDILLCKLLTSTN